MRLSTTILIAYFAFYMSYGTCATPTVNPECQSLASLINALKARLDQIPLNLVPIPGLDPSKKTTLKCSEYADCSGFNCSGQVYGRHIQFSFSLNYCATPVTANISATYPDENVTIARTIKHSDEFFITEFSFKVPLTNITIPVKLFGKISMTRLPGKVLVTAGIIPKLALSLPLTPQPFDIVQNQEINVDTSRCGDEISSVSTSTATSGSVSNQPLGNSGALSGGSIAAIVMSIVAFIAIVIAATLYWNRHTIFKSYALQNDKANSNVAI